MILVISSSLHPDSRSRIMARTCFERLQHLEENVTLFDLSESPLPMCDGATAYGDSNVQRLSGLLSEADAILLASPVYNYDVNSAAKNAVELTGRAWTGKVVGMMLAAGGQGSYMSAMGLANSLMLDFRCVIVPRFIYATGESFEGNQLADETIQERVELLVDDTLKIAKGIKQMSSNS
jgi:NAD(P)H-dependent FMN reductase